MRTEFCETLRVTKRVEHALAKNTPLWQLCPFKLKKTNEGFGHERKGTKALDPIELTDCTSLALSQNPPRAVKTLRRAKLRCTKLQFTDVGIQLYVNHCSSVWRRKPCCMNSLVFQSSQTLNLASTETRGHSGTSHTG